MHPHRISTINRIKIVSLLAVIALALSVVLIGARSSGTIVKAKGGATASRETASTDDAQTPSAKPAPASGTATATAATAPAKATDDNSPKVEGCVVCHKDIEPMHVPQGQEGKAKIDAQGKDGIGLSCTACHGGNPFGTTAEDSHVKPRFPERWQRNGKATSSNPENTNADILRESYEFVRFVNPGDMRVARQTCGGCHSKESEHVASSMHVHGAMLWGAALYNNGGYPLKDTRFGESYSEDGAPQELWRLPHPTAQETKFKGILTFLQPLPRWEISQPGNVLRVFERGGRRRLEVGLPDRDEDPGKPDKGLSPRGLGTLQRTDPVYLGLQKTRLLDPLLSFLGTNDWPGDYRSSGCTACHTVYANDRSPVHSSIYADIGNEGTTKSADQSIPRDEPGHPIKHTFTSRIPSSQCMVCHMHPGTNMVATYYGMTWWDNETDGDKMYLDKQHTPSQDEEQYKLNHNPEASSLRGKWSDRDFLAKTGTPEFNDQLKRTQLADFHGHGWLFRTVFKRNRNGEFLDAKGKVMPQPDGKTMREAAAFRDSDNHELKNESIKDGMPVHLKDIHLEKGMHCADCHFSQDTHGNGNLYNEPRAAIEIGCIDCHGTIQKRATLMTSGPAAGQGLFNGKIINRTAGRDLTKRQASGDEIDTYYALDAKGKHISIFQRGPLTKIDPTTKKEVQIKEGQIVQNSVVEPGMWWRVKQTIDSVTPKNPDGTDNPDYNQKSAYAKTIRTDNQTWGDVPKDEKELAHKDSDMTCYACHSSWMTSCFGCHLSMQANRKMPNRHNEGDNSRNFTTYNFQVLRDDVFMLGRDGTVTGHRIAPVRSSSAILVSSQNQNREWIYSQQQTISSEGYSGQAFNTHVPHTVRATETKGCTDCHVSKNNDNNAWMAQLMLQGTNFVNFMGRYIYIAADDALEVVPVTERTEPQAVIGSTLHKVAYPDSYAKFEREGRELKTAFEHVGNPRALQVQLRGEYAYVAAGEGGLRIYDVAQIDHKGFSERITTAPVSRFGQKFYVKTKYATAVAAPTTLGVDPARTHNPINEEQPIHLLYAFLYVVDKYEGLILVNAATLLDGDPLNNYLKRALDPAKHPNGAFNPGGALEGANNITIAGTHAYITTEKGLFVVDINNPLEPKTVSQITAPALKNPRAFAVQFRYGFVVDEEGLKVVDITKPERARLVEGAGVPLKEALSVYVARTYAYVANGKEGVAIINVERPEKPRLDQMFDADGKITDAHDVKIAMTNASAFAYVADGKNGLRILQITSPETMATYAGFSPRPEPRLISTFKTKGEALYISKGLDRDRAVDESGNQTAVFGRRGARPFTLEEMQRMYLLGGELFTVSDDPPNAPRTTTKSATIKAISSPAEKLKAISLSLSAPQHRMKTTAIIGGLGLFACAVGWRRSRRRSRRRDGEK
ncbi:MAG: hypothetical protein ABR577_17350 [Pyrinomonadaceae bacterium]